MSRSGSAIGTEPQPSAAPSRPPGVLVVDDDESVRAFLAAGLAASGFAVWAAADGFEAVAAVRDHGPAIDLVVLDVRMPGPDGPETLRGIRALDPDVPCCFMTADAGSYTEEDLLGFGAAAVFWKPFQLGVLLARLADSSP
jgi:DNA-binding response OmpR family regulator